MKNKQTTKPVTENDYTTYRELADEIIRERNAKSQRSRDLLENKLKEVTKGKIMNIKIKIDTLSLV